MKTGLESLDTGAPEITYSGNQGPKSPQEDQRMMQEFQMAQLEEEYAKYVFEMEEQGIQPMSMQQFIEQAMAEARQGVKDGGVMQLVKKNKDGSRPGYRGDDAARSSEGTSAGRSDPGAGAGYGDGPASGNTGSKGDDAKLEYLTGGYQDIDLDKEQKENFKNFQKQVGYSISPSSKPSNRIIGGILSAVTGIPGLGYLTGKAMDSTAMGYGTTTKNDDDDDDDYGGDDYIPTPTVNLASIAKPITTDIEDENTFELRPDDFVSRYSIPDQFRLADGGRIGYAGGGITDLRQGYFLGKLVKKATRAVKKIAKSPLGKAALLYAGGTYLGGLKSLSGAKSSMGFLESLRTPSNLRNLVNIRNLIPGFGNNETATLQETFSEMVAKNSKLPPSMQVTRSELMDFAKNQVASNSTKKTPGLGTLAAIALPAIAGGLYTKKTEEDQPTLDEAMAQTSRGTSPFDKYNGVQGFRDMIGRGNLDRSMFPFLQPTSYAADGGRMGLKEGGIGNLRGALSKEMFGYDDEDEDIIKLAMGGSAGMPPITMQTEGMDLMSFPDDESTGMAQATPTTTLPNQMPIRQPMMNPMMQQRMMQQRMNPMMGGRMMAQEGGMMDMGGMEKDYRNEGGFVPIGGQERADDVPARLSKNEFVFTADAVRNAGGGDIDKGAKIMENMMENLEAGGKVSKGSQGLKGAREMFATQKRLGEVL